MTEETPPEVGWLHYRLAVAFCATVITANFFAFLWGTHPAWSKLGGWLEEHESAAAALGWLLVAALIGFFWYAFR